MSPAASLIPGELKPRHGLKVATLYGVLTPEVSPEYEPDAEDGSRLKVPPEVSTLVPAAGSPDAAAGRGGDLASTRIPAWVSEKQAAQTLRLKAPEQIVQEAETHDVCEGRTAEFEQFVKDHLGDDNQEEKDEALGEYLEALQTGTLKVRTMLDQKWGAETQARYALARRLHEQDGSGETPDADGLAQRGFAIL